MSSLPLPEGTPALYSEFRHPSLGPWPHPRTKNICETSIMFGPTKPGTAWWGWEVGWGVLFQSLTSSLLSTYCVPDMCLKDTFQQTWKLAWLYDYRMTARGNTGKRVLKPQIHC